MTPDGFGAAMAVLGIATFLGTFIDFGAATQATRSLAQGDDPRDGYLPKLTIRSGLALVTLVIGILAHVAATPKIGLYGLIPTIASLVTLEQFTLAPLRATNRNGHVSSVLVADKVACLSFILICFYTDSTSPASLLFAIIVGASLGIILCLVLTRRTVRGWRNFRWVNPFDRSLHLGIGSVAVGGQFLDIQVLSLSSGPSAAGQYAAVARWGGPLGMISTALTQSAFPKMSSASSHRAAWTYLRDALVVLTLPALLLTVLALFAGKIVEVLLGEAYAESAPVIRVLAVALIIALANQPLSGFLQARGDERSTALVLSSGVILQIFSIYIFGKMGGSIGGAYAFMLAQSLMASGFLWRVKALLAQEVNEDESLSTDSA